MIKIAPSILSADFGHLAREVQAVERAGADWLHVDVMDGHFVPNLTIGPGVVRSLRPCSPIFFDVHLMMDDPGAYAEAFAQAGADLICFHYEAVPEPGRVIERVRALGKQVGLAIKPATPARVLLPYLAQLDLVLVMTVEPGFGGQAFLPEQLQKARELRAEIDRAGLHTLVEADGGLNTRTAGVAAAAGVQVLVAGSAVYGEPDYAQAVRALRQAAQTPPAQAIG